jgi:hypothetical protein
MKHTRWLVSVLLAVVLLVSCGGGSGENGSGGSVDASGHITLDFWYALGGDAGAAIEEMVANFNASQSDITVIATYQGDYTSAMAKIYSAIAGETYPNVVHVGGAPLLGSSGAILPISDFSATDTSFDLSLIRPAFLPGESCGACLLIILSRSCTTTRISLLLPGSIRRVRPKTWMNCLPRPRLSRLARMPAVCRPSGG